jgi:hypothetical protein
MVSTLHERLLVVIGQHGGPLGTGAALRAVVELHRPVSFWRPYPDPEQCYSCRSDRSDTGTVTWPCSTIQAIARELGVDSA